MGATRSGFPLRCSNRRTASACLLSFVVFGAASHAAADTPPTPVPAGEVADRVIGDDAHTRAHFEWRTVTPESLGVGEAEVRSYRARASLRLSGTPTGIASYAGFDVGVQLVRGYSSEAVRGPGVGVGSLDVGTGANAVLGFRLPVGEHASLYAEGRAGLGSDLGPSQSDRLRIEGRGDYSGFAGLRLSF